MSDCPRRNQPERYECGCTTQEMYYCSVARIAELEAENKRLRLEAAHANDTADVAIERAKKLEAKLAKALAELERLGFDFQCIVGRELKGQDDE